jgi:hypothetical protein
MIRIRNTTKKQNNSTQVKYEELLNHMSKTCNCATKKANQIASKLDMDAIKKS